VLAATLLRRLLLASAIAAVPGHALAQAGEVNVYTTREAGLIKPLFDAFTKETGITANTIFIKDGLTERVRSEGANSPADVMITVDAGRLIELVEAGVTQNIDSDALEEAVPENLRGENGEWFALSLRSRVAYVSKDRVKDTELTYEGLADPKWKGKLCIRSAQHPYNTELIAAYIAHHGEADTQKWLEGMKANLARKPAGGDRDGAKDILAGTCDIAVANSYYVGLMRNSKEEQQRGWGEAINVILPTFEDGGTHVNITGAAVAKNAPNRDNAVKLLEYLVSPAAQAIYAKQNFEYPVTEGAEVDATVSSFGKLEADDTSLTEIVSHRKQASELVDKVGFDN
jgi:iron(III) transport system substrate-binding protein